MQNRLVYNPIRKTQEYKYVYTACTARGGASRRTCPVCRGSGYIDTGVHEAEPGVAVATQRSAQPPTPAPSSAQPSQLGVPAQKDFADHTDPSSIPAWFKLAGVVAAARLVAWLNKDKEKKP